MVTMTSRVQRSGMVILVHIDPDLASETVRAQSMAGVTSR